MKLGRIGGNTDRTDWGGVYTPSDNVVKIEKTDNIDDYQWRRNYSHNGPFYRVLYPSISYGDNGRKIYVSDGSARTNSEIRQYDLTTPYEPSTASYTTLLQLYWGPIHYHLNTAFNYDGTKMYISYYDNNNTNFVPPEQFDLSTPWDVSTAVPRVKKLYLGDQEIEPHGIYVKPDGTKFYIIGSAGDDVNEYNMSTPFDVSTGVFSQKFSVGAQEITPYGIEFKPDGTKMYVVGATGDDINEYDLSTPWDVSTASYNQNFSVSAQETAPMAVRFKPDGTKMYVTGSTGDDVNEYDLSTPWDVSTASFVQNKGTGESLQYGLTFTSDGAKMYTSGDALDRIKEWDLSTPWDVSTAVFYQDSGELMGAPSGIFLSNTNVGVATTAVTGTRGDLGISASIHSAGVNIDSYFLESTTIIDEEGSQNLESGSTVISLDTTSGITTGSGKFLSIENELIGLSTASISDNTISNIARGQLGTSDVAHTDESSVKFLTEYTGIGTLHTTVGISTTEILISTNEVLTSKVNTGGFIRIDSSEFVGVSTLFTGGSVIPVEDRFFVIDAVQDNVRSYTLNTDKDIRSIDGILQGDDEMSGNAYDQLGGVAISEDGTKFFVMDLDTRDRLTEFTLPTPYELTGATRTGNFISINTGTDESQPFAMHFSEDGTKIYMAGGDDTRSIYLYKLSTAWDITTATLTKQRLNIYSDLHSNTSNYDTLTEPRYYGAGVLADIEGLAVSKDGTNILIANTNNFSEFKLPV